jgi:hypothetical protein
MSMVWENVPEMRQPAGPQMIYDYGEPRWNDTDGRIQKENLSHCHCVHHKFHMDWPRREPGPLQWDQWLTAWAMARPLEHIQMEKNFIWEIHYVCKTAMLAQSTLCPFLQF